MIKHLVYIYLLCIPLSLIAQKDQLSYNRLSGQKFFPSTLKYKPSGWILAPGITKLYVNTPNSITDNVNGIDYRFKPGSKIALYGEIGRYKIFKYWGFFKYLDYGLAYKRFSGLEEVSGSDGTDVSHTFIDQHVTGHFNLNNIIELSNPFFIQNSLGFSVNYAFDKLRTPGLSIGETFPDPGFAQLHYKFGLGIFATKKLLIIPSIELPLISAYPLGPIPTLTYFSSNYYPAIFTLKFMFLRDGREDCPPVFAPGLPDGFVPDGQNSP